MNGIIVPTHLHHFHFTYNLLKSASQEEEIILIFSSEEEYKQFEMPCKYLIIENNQDKIHSAATFKKLKALEILADKYDYLATIDTETIFLRPVTPHLKEIWDNNCFVANFSRRGHEIIEECIKTLNIDYKLDPNLYFWFNDIPVYKTSYIREFLDYLPEVIYYYSFDHMLFTIFMMEKHNQQLKIINGMPEYSIIEELSLEQNASMRYLAGKTNWSTYFNGVEKLDNIKMLFHLDRYPHAI